MTLEHLEVYFTYNLSYKMKKIMKMFSLHMCFLHTHVLCPYLCTYNVLIEHTKHLSYFSFIMISYDMCVVYENSGKQQKTNHPFRTAYLDQTIEFSIR